MDLLTIVALFSRASNTGYSGRWIVSFDPVNITNDFLDTKYIYDNTKFYTIIYATDPGFTQIKPFIYGTNISPKSYYLDYRGTHNDVGGDGEDDKALNQASREFMMDQMRKNGLSIKETPGEKLFKMDVSRILAP